MKHFDNFKDFHNHTNETKKDLYSGNILVLTPDKTQYFQIEVPFYGSHGSIGWGLLLSHHKIKELIALNHMFPKEVIIFDQDLDGLCLAVMLHKNSYSNHLNAGNIVKAKNTHYVKKKFETKIENTNFISKNIFSFIEDIEDIYERVLTKDKKSAFNNYCYNEDTDLLYYQLINHRFMPIIVDFIDLKKNINTYKNELDFSHLEGTFGNCNIYGQKHMVQSDFDLLYKIYQLDKKQENALAFPSYLYEKFNFLDEKQILSQEVNGIEVKRQLNKL